MWTVPNTLDAKSMDHGLMTNHDTASLLRLGLGCRRRVLIFVVRAMFFMILGVKMRL
jgi:hypothetical protein